MNLSHEEIARMIECPAVSVATHWPLVLACLEALGVASERSQIAALATIAIETANRFEPIHEFGSRDYFIKHYDGRKDLGNTHAGDGVTYCGRGFIQITGLLNYAAYGKLLGIDLIDDPNDPNDDNDPEKACDSNIAAAIFAAYFHDHKINLAADVGDWLKCRKLVNGGTNGIKPFMIYVARLLRATSDVGAKHETNTAIA